MQTESLAPSHLQCTTVQPLSENCCFARKIPYPLLCFNQFPLLGMTYSVEYPFGWLESALSPHNFLPMASYSLEEQDWWEAKSLDAVEAMYSIFRVLVWCQHCFGYNPKTPKYHVHSYEGS